MSVARRWVATNPDCYYGDHTWSGAVCTRCGKVNGALLSWFRYEKAEREGRAHGDHFHRTLDAKAVCTRPTDEP